ncbi:MAG: hypothetical protein ABI822_02890, partial [Bryobacteraceae bacterium]
MIKFEESQEAAARAWRPGRTNCNRISTIQSEGDVGEVYSTITTGFDNSPISGTVMVTVSP